MFKTMDPLPAGRHRAACAAWHNNLYVLGGASNSGSTAGPTTILKSRINAVDDGNTPWVECASEFPTAKIGAKAIVLDANRGGGNGVLMVIGGRGATVQAADVNAAADIWIGKLDSDGNIPRWNHLVGVLPSNLTDVSVMRSDSHIFLVGGLDIKVIMSFKTQTTETRLKYKTQTVNFTVGQVLTGGTSGATGTISADVDAGATGTLTLTGVVGTFQNNEAITDALGGAAVANGTQYSWGDFVAGEVITGGTSAATATIVSVNDAGATGTLILKDVSGTFVNNEDLTGNLVGFAKADGTTALYQTAQNKIWRAKLDSDGMSLGGFSQVGLLPAAISPINAVAMDRKRLVISDTTSVYTARIEPSGEILPWVTSTAPESKVDHAMVLMQNNDLVVLGGYNGANVKPSCWSTSIEPDGGLKRWTLQSSMITEAMNCGVAVMGDRIFMIGGLDDASNVLTSVQVCRVNPDGQF